MKIQVLSDLHFEFHADRGRSFVDSLSADANTIIIAGDLCNASLIENALAMFCDKYENVIYVVGNHEFYGSSPVKIKKIYESKHPSNLHWLWHTAAIINDITFVGTPLWFRNSKAVQYNKHYFSDFRSIREFDPWVFDDNTAAIRFLTSIEADVVVTHYLPSYRSVHPRFAGSELNSYFVCEIDDIIEKTRPKLWIHGHTHDSCDYKIGRTRIVCNPFGYAQHELNRSFEDQFVVEV